MSNGKQKLSELQKWMESVDKRLDNHLVHSATDIAQIKNDLAWVKQFFWLVASTSIVAIIGALLSFVLK